MHNLVLLFVATAFALVACTGTPTPTPSREPTVALPTTTLIPGNLRVWLQDRDSGAYILSATIVITGPSGIQTGSTGTSGQAYFGVLVPGIYTISASASDYVSSDLEQQTVASSVTVSHTLYLVRLIPTPTKTTMLSTDTPTPPTGTLTVTPLAIPTATPTLVYAAPVLRGPPPGSSFAGNNTVLRWDFDRELKPDEVFDVLVWPEGSVQATSIGSTREKNFAIDFRKWQYGRPLIKFLWTVRIKRVDGTYLSDASQPFSFTITEPPPTAPPPPPTPRPYP